jgi:hypothetical protein
MHHRWIGVLISVILLVCLVSPFVEDAVHSNGTILDGQDNESTVAILALCAALALAVASLVLIRCIGTCFETLLARGSCRHITILAALPRIDSGTAPPLSLRI